MNTVGPNNTDIYEMPTIVFSFPCNAVIKQTMPALGEPCDGHEKLNPEALIIINPASTKLVKIGSMIIFITDEELPEVKSPNMPVPSTTKNV